MSASETYFVAATTVTLGPATGSDRVARGADRRGRHGAPRARARAAPRGSFRVGSSTTSSSSSPQHAARARAPHGSRSRSGREPSTASSCKSVRAVLALPRRGPGSGRAPRAPRRGTLFDREVGVLVHQELGGELGSMRRQETAGGPGVDRSPSSWNACSRDDGDHLVLEPRPGSAAGAGHAVPAPRPARHGRRATEAVCLGLAEVVQQAPPGVRRAERPQSAASWTTAKRCSSSGNGWRGVRACSRSPRANSGQHHFEHTGVARQPQRAPRLAAEQQELRQLAHAVRLRTAADALRRDVARPPASSRICASVSPDGLEAELRDEPQPAQEPQRILAKAAAGRRCAARGARGRRRRRTGRRARRWPAGARSR